jgi:hypothetical protein
MLRQLLLICCAIFAFSTLATAQKPSKTTPSKTTPSKTTTTKTITGIGTDREKKDVETFGLSIIESYFRQDCDFVWNRFGRTIQSIESGEVFETTPDLKTELCAENPLRTDTNVSFTIYKQNYTQKVYNSAEVAALNPELHQRLQMQVGDYLFDGSQRTSTTAASVFRASDAARFFVRRKGTSWMIIAI